MRSIRLFAPSFALLLAACLGCDGSALHPVTGTVTHQDKPVDGASVIFTPVGEGIAANATTDANGKYTLMTAGKPGANAGDYKVTVTKVSGGPGDTASMKPEDMAKMAQSGGGMKARTQVLPPVYGSVTTTTLQATVKAGTNDFPLDLK